MILMVNIDWMSSARWHWILALHVILFIACITAIDDGAKSPNTVHPKDIRPMNFYLTEQDKEVVRKNLICHGWQCPNYSVVKDHSALIQERHYPAMNVIVASADGCLNFSSALVATYMKLLRYRHGENSKGVDVTMTVPVVARFVPDPVKPCKQTFQLWFYVNATDFRDGIPQPTEEGVTILKNPPMNVFVSTVGGKSADPEKILTIAETDMKLSKLKACYNPQRYKYAMYDMPWKKHGRRTEVWFEKTC